MCFPPRCFFGQVRLARSNFTCVALAGFGNCDWCGQLFRHLHGRFGYIRVKVLGCAFGPSHFNFGKSAKASPLPASFAPNKSFKPTPCRGIGYVLYATLARIRRPDTGRLNSGVRPALKLLFSRRRTWAFLAINHLVITNESMIGI